ncbi:hypothetical protein V6N11_058606 [Hibiscus sabdariffa]|uniref:Uncharacterized protein n=1 Tax=Hibiscus sabdariffa TaxID=183260 RepID=A0ABR2U4Q8_9ROSI
MTASSHGQINDMQSKLVSFFHYTRERDATLQTYFLELLPDENQLFPAFPEEIFQPAKPAKQGTQHEQPTTKPAPKKKHVTSTSTAIPTQAPIPTPVEPTTTQVPPARTPDTNTPSSVLRPSTKTPSSSRRVLTRKDKGKAPIKPTPCNTLHSTLA